jgi:hypothetical protein
LGEGFFYARHLMGAKIIGDDDVAWLECWSKNMLDIRQEGLSVKWPIKKPRGLDTIVA